VDAQTVRLRAAPTSGRGAHRVDLRNNSFDALRLLLAALVIVSHSMPISGLADEPRLGDIKLGTLAVAGFFAVSGFLVTGSRLRSTLASFAWRRFLRIYPGYWVCLAFTAFVAASIGGAVRGGWTATNAALHVASGLLMFGTLPLSTDSLVGAPLAGSWNGSLWSLPYEVMCYVAVGVVFSVVWMRRRGGLVILAFVVATAASLLVVPATDHGFLRNLLVVVPFFLAGMVFLFHEDRIPLTGTGALVAVVLLGAAAYGHRAESLAGLPVTYLLLWLSGALPAWTRNWGHRADLSYGAYLYGFPLQQLLVVAGAQRFGLSAFVLLSLLVTAPVAGLSWFLVERPAMRLRNRSRRAAPDMRLS
jgi:peptidoglycan/LPS O-acetylase OafA/YrhL